MNEARYASYFSLFNLQNSPTWVAMWMTGICHQYHWQGHQGWKGRLASSSKSSLTRNSRWFGYPIASKWAFRYILLWWTSESVLSAIQVLHTIRNRYAQHSIYTYSGIVLIAVNPFQRVTLYGPEIIQAYSGRKRGDLEPHLFAIAEDAYTAMAKEGMGQTIIVSGER